MANKQYDTSLLERYLATFGLELEKEYGYIPKRRFRADYAIKEWRILIEIQGGIFNKKAHGSITGLLKDIERLNLATIYGWQVLRLTPQEFKKTQCINLLEMWRNERSS